MARQRFTDMKKDILPGMFIPRGIHKFRMFPTALERSKVLPQNKVGENGAIIRFLPSKKAVPINNSYHLAIWTRTEETPASFNWGATIKKRIKKRRKGNISLIFYA